MELFFQFFVLLVGLLLLWKVGEKAVQNAISFSHIYQIESFTIGFFIFSISTGLPEISSAVISSVKEVPELSSGVLMGSTLVNMTLILGITVLIAKELPIAHHLRKKFFATIALILLIFVGLSLAPQVNFLAGLLLVLIYVGSALWFQLGLPRKEVIQELGEAGRIVAKMETRAIFPPKIDILIKLGISLTLLLLSSWITIRAATEISELLGLHLSQVGATFIAIGTSLPELALEIHAIRKKEYALALGDIFGSSLLNISLILGLLIMINPRIDFSIVLKILPFVAFTIFWVVCRLIRQRPLKKGDAFVFLAIFFIYFVTIFTNFSTLLESHV